MFNGPGGCWDVAERAGELWWIAGGVDGGR